MIKQYHCTYDHCGAGWGEIKSTMDGTCPVCAQTVKPESLQIVWIEDGKIIEKREVLGYAD